MRLKAIWSYVVVFLPAVCLGQIGGQSAFNFLKMPSNARVSALGGMNVSLVEEDVNLLFSNPGLIGEDWDNHAAVNFVPYYADVSLSSVAYAKEIADRGVWAVGLQYLNLGQLEARDESGGELGDFNAREYFFVLGRSHKIGPFQIGSGLKWAFSSMGMYHAHALMIDIGGVFIHPEQEFTVGLAIRNLGLVLGDYTETSGSSLPFDVQLGVTIKPEHMPVRFSLTGHHLANYRLPYDSEENLPGLNNDRPGTVDKILSHINAGAELLISKNFNIRGGYNHLINSELSLAELSRGTGLSYGFMFRIKAFEFSFSRAIYHVSGGTSFFSLQSDLNSIFSKEN